MTSVSKGVDFTKRLFVLGLMVITMCLLPSAWADEDEDDQGGDDTTEAPEAYEVTDEDDTPLKDNPAPRYGLGGILARPLSLPAGTALKAKLTHPIDASINRVGDPVRLTLTETFSVEGVVIARPNSVLKGVVEAVRPANHRGIPAYIQVRLYTLKPTHGEFSLPINAVMDVPDNTVGRRFGGRQLGLNTGKVLPFILDESMTIGPEYLAPPSEWEASKKRRRI